MMQKNIFASLKTPNFAGSERVQVAEEQLFYSRYSQRLDRLQHRHLLHLQERSPAPDHLRVSRGYPLVDGARGGGGEREESHQHHGGHAGQEHDQTRQW